MALDHLLVPDPLISLLG
jgi:hypothetical protein